jgi:hypothetical protein
MVKSIAVGSLINVIRPTYLYSTSDMSFTSDRGVWILSQELVIILQVKHAPVECPGGHPVADRFLIFEVVSACGKTGWLFSFGLAAY